MSRSLGLSAPRRFLWPARVSRRRSEMRRAAPAVRGSQLGALGRCSISAALSGVLQASCSCRGARRGRKGGREERRGREGGGGGRMGVGLCRAGTCSLFWGSSREGLSPCSQLACFAFTAGLCIGLSVQREGGFYAAVISSQRKDSPRRMGVCCGNKFALHSKCKLRSMYFTHKITSVSPQCPHSSLVRLPGVFLCGHSVGLG